MAEHLLLKWGTLKGWQVESDASKAALQRYCAEPVSGGCLSQRDTPGQTQALCDLIDAIDGDIRNDWTGEILTKEAAKEYVRRNAPASEDAQTIASQPNGERDHA